MIRFTLIIHFSFFVVVFFSVSQMYQHVNCSHHRFYSALQRSLNLPSNQNHALYLATSLTGWQHLSSFSSLQVRTPTVIGATQRWADAIEMGEPQESSRRPAWSR